jgi:hypothetical protein
VVCWWRCPASQSSYTVGLECVWRGKHRLQQGCLSPTTLVAPTLVLDANTASLDIKNLKLHHMSIPLRIALHPSRSRRVCAAVPRGLRHHAPLVPA